MATNADNPTRPETLARIDWLSLALFLSPVVVAAMHGLAGGL